MKCLLAFILSCAVLNSYATKLMSPGNRISNRTNSEITMLGSDSLPTVFPVNHADIVGSRLKNEAYLKFMQYNLPASKHEWETFSNQLKNEIIEKAGIVIDHELPLDYHETGIIKMEGYTIKNIFFQTISGVYATANLYIPDGNGSFPAVINMHGHWPEARLCNQVQSVGQTLVLNGYVCLSMDVFGAGERSTIHGTPEYHGANLGSSILNIGKTLLGIQVSENMRGVDLLLSLPFVDTKNIGATGASGGGNQTMWLTALDDRIKVSVPVVSVGTFESYVMGSNCACELLIDGLDITEESGVLALIAPRAVLVLNHNQEINPTFFPSEMLRSFNNAKPVFEMLGVSKNLSCQFFDLIHDYAPADREAMLGWFNLHLKRKGTGLPIKEIAFKNLPPDQLMVFARGQRDPKVLSIEEYTKRIGGELRNTFLSITTFDQDLKKKELQKILRINDVPSIKKIHQYSRISGWERFALESTDGKLLPLLHLTPRNKALGYTILCDPRGKNYIPKSIIDELMEKGSGIVIIDLSGTGEASSTISNTLDVGLIKFHTLSRSELWLGKTVLGEWVDELNMVTQFLKLKFEANSASIDASREAGMAALYFSVLHGEKIDSIILREAPVSYLFDTRVGIDFFSMAIHLPGFLNWGDVSLVAALSDKNINFINPVTMSGNAINGEKLQIARAEFERMKKICHSTGKTIFK